MPNKLNTEIFVKRSKLLHSNKYNYSITIYKNIRTDVSIICPEHGVFIQKAKIHLDGKGCKKCYHNKRRDTKEQFIEKANKIHSNKYDYSLVDYIQSKKKVIITCREHGKFEQKPYLHLSGQGCLECHLINKKSYNCKIAEQNKEEFKNKNAILYLINVYSEKENFYKIGITVQSLKRRFSSIKNNYQYNTIKIIHTNLYDAISLENKILKENKQYIPKIKFGGYTECFLERPNI